MKLYSLAEPRNSQFAYASRLGSWEDEDRICPECTRSLARRVQPIVIEWEPGSELIGDFVWPWVGTDIVTKIEVFRELNTKFGGLESGTVEMVQNTKLKRPLRTTVRTKPRIWLPYQGPTLVELLPTEWVHVDKEKSSLRLIKHCSMCDTDFYAIDGIESKTIDWDKDQMQPVEIHTRRIPGKGVFVNSIKTHQSSIFRLVELPGMVICNMEVKEYIENQGYTNIDFMEIGDAL